MRFFLHVFVPGFLIAALVLRDSLYGFGTVLPGDTGDTLLNLFFFEHNLSSLPDLSKWISAGFYFPVEGVRAWSDHLALPTLIYGVFRLLAFDEYQSLGLWFFFVIAFNYVSLRLALWLLGLRGLIVTAVCIACAFNHALIAQLNHLQLLMLWFFPLLAYSLLRSRWMIAVLAVGLNWLVAPYLGVSSILIYLVYLMVSFLADRSHFVSHFFCVGNWKVSRPALLLVITVLVLNLFLIQPYLNTASVMGVRGTDEILKNLPNGWAWISGTGRQLFGLSAHEMVVGNEPNLFPGFVLSALFVVSLFRVNRLDLCLRQFLLVVVVLGFSVTLFWGWTMWWVPMFAVPSVRALNAAGRIGAVLWFVSAFPLASCAQSLFHVKALPVASSKRILPLAFVVATALSVFPVSSSTFDITDWSKDQRGFSDLVLEENCGVIHFDAGDRFPWHGDVFAMHSLLRNSSLKSVTGYSGWQPREGWKPGMSAQESFRWMRNNLGSKNYMPVSSLDEASLLCALRPAKDYLPGSGLFALDIR